MPDLALDTFTSASRDGIEADTPEEAARIAGDKHFDDCDEWSDCEGANLAALVDYAPYEGTVVDFEAGRLLTVGTKLINWTAGFASTLIPALKPRTLRARNKPIRRHPL